jgi:phosphate transport system protein
MPTSAHGFQQRTDELKATLAAQGLRVQRLLEAACDAAFERSPAAAAAALRLDDDVDRIDVEIEKAAVALLTDATAAGAALAPDQLRTVLTIVKVNNELERIADCGTFIAELVPDLASAGVSLSDAHRVITNSTLGILRDCCQALDRNDPHLAKVVLASEDAVGAFKRAILREANMDVSRGLMSVDAAFCIHELTTLCEMITEHCTNIAEQALYAATGSIMRHMNGQWQEIRSQPS